MGRDWLVGPLGVRRPHHGPFSSPDPAGPETFTEIALVFDGQRYHDDLAGDRLLAGEEVTLRMKPLGLKSVPEVLTDLRHLS